MKKLIFVCLIAGITAACGNNEVEHGEISAEEFEKDFLMVDTVKSMTNEQIDAYADSMIEAGELCFVLVGKQEMYYGTLICLLKDDYNLHNAIYSSEYTAPDVQIRVKRFGEKMNVALADKYGKDFRTKVVEEAKLLHESGNGFVFPDYNYQDVVVLCQTRLEQKTKEDAAYALINIDTSANVNLTAILDKDEKPVPLTDKEKKLVSEGLIAIKPVTWKGKSIPWNDKIYIGGTGF